MLSALPLVLDVSALPVASELSALTSEDEFSFESVDFSSFSPSFSFSTSFSADGEVVSLSSFFAGLEDFSPSSGISIICKKKKERQNDSWRHEERQSETDRCLQKESV